MNNKLFKLSATILVCLSLTIFTWGQKNTSVNLKVTIDNSVSAAAGVQSDGNPYQNGLDSVQAVFNSYGHFVFNSGTRPVSFLYSIPLDGNFILPTDSKIGVKSRTFPINSAAYTRLQDMTDGQSQCLGLLWEINLGNNTTRGVTYQYGGGFQTNTAYVVVTYSAATFSWTMDSVESPINCGGNNTNNNAARVRDTQTIRNKSTITDNGRYYMPFKLTLSKQ